MGSILSSLSTEAILTLFVAAGAVGYTLARHQLAEKATAAGAAAPATSASAPSAPAKKGGKKKKAAAPADEQATPKPPPAVVVAFPDVVPGGFDASSTGRPATPSEREDTGAASSSSALAKKSKKKKTKKAPAAAAAAAVAPGSTADEQSDAPAPAKKPSATHLNVPSEPWTRVETRRGKGAQKGGAEAAQSDAGITTSVTGTSSPGTAETDDEGVASEDASRGQSTMRPLAERLLPKPRKTGVEDMVETPDHPTVSRVMRVQPPPGEKPAAGFSWGDYEDVRAGNDADAEGDGGGWSVAKPKRPTSQLATSSSSAAPKPSASAQSAADSKKARQNAAKRDAQKAAKAEAEAARLAILAKHKRDLERTKAAEQAAAKGKSSRQPDSKASIDENGKLVWD